MIRNTRKTLTTALFIIIVGTIASLCIAANPQVKRRSHWALRGISLTSALSGLTGAIYLNNKSNGLVTPYAKSTYLLHLSPKPCTGSDVIRLIQICMDHLPPSAQFTAALAACGLITGVAATGYGIFSLGYNAGRCVFGNKQEAKDGMIRGFTTAACGIGACAISGIAWFTIAHGIEKTLNTHEPVLAPIRAIRTTLKI